eukprot:TRINITY_DN21275_c0_g1_i2.p1 TRINITY_DN21275_c0_g1~~TRINITY_DN21275_c0_g1_i2.p1  ORF type:complete len:209 (-),score=39.78 TRINITY_DN21275_c0_g1_i2:4-630(-)
MFSVDPAKREDYRLFGASGSGDDDLRDFRNAESFVSQLFPRMSAEEFVERLKDFESSYKSGAEERDDVLEHIRKRHGDASQLLEFIPLSSSEDLPRYEQIVTTAFRDGTLSGDFEPLFSKSIKKALAKASEFEAKEKRMFAREQRRAAGKKSAGSSLTKAGSGGGLASLAAAIQANAQKRSATAALALDSWASAAGALNSERAAKKRR